jgi:DNA-directed RNA polymerase specialized sigma24 family protein
VIPLKPPDVPKLRKTDANLLRSLPNSTHIELLERLKRPASFAPGYHWKTGTPPVNAQRQQEYLELIALAASGECVAIVLRHGMGYSVQEAAELTEVSINTVKDRLLHARAQLRASIRRDGVPASGQSRSQR